MGVVGYLEGVEGRVFQTAILDDGGQLNKVR